MRKIFMSKLKKNLQNEHFGEILSGSFLSFVSKILTVLLGFISNFIIVKYYGSEILGKLSVLISVVTLGSVFGVFGLDVSILRFIPQLLKKSIGSIYYTLKRSFYMLLLSGFVVSIVVFIFSEQIAVSGFKKSDLSSLISYVSFFIVFNVLGKFSASCIRAFKDIKQFVILQSLPSILNIIFLVLSTFLFFHEYNPILVQFTSQFLVILITIFYLVKYVLKYRGYSDLNGLSFKSILSISFPMFLTVVIQIIVLQTDVLMLGRIDSFQNVGIYSIVMKLSLLSAFIISSINTMTAPKIAELFYNDNHEDLYLMIKKSTKLIFFGTFPITLILIFAGQLLLGIFGEEFEAGYIALIMLTIGQLISAMSGSVGYFLNMTGHQKILNRILFLGGIINVILNIILIPKFGISGAAFASMVSMILWNIIASFYIRSKFGFYISYVPFLSNRKN